MLPYVGVENCERGEAVGLFAQYFLPIGPLIGAVLMRFGDTAKSPWIKERGRAQPLRQKNTSGGEGGQQVSTPG